jgi:capsular exopolysaccharide synthesis family protein
MALSRGGYRVLVVDADFRRPQLHAHCDVDVDHSGLAQILQGEARLDEAIQTSSHPNLDVLVAGAAEGQAELLDSDRFTAFLHAVDHGYDFVLVDSPPLGLYTDGAALASRVGRALLVVDATRPSSESEFRSLTLLRRTGAVVEGVIVNKINPEYVNPMKLRSLPPHVVDLSVVVPGNGNGNGNGHGPNGNGNGHASNGNGHGATSTTRSHG